ncbi:MULTISPECIES: LacI family DNA-binding transcriptional regulator [Bifidobacterium]|jgi:LacI family sucrose operon transcriptional repressor|uniref:LacI family DNA-binding transcriptional regulator n=1 Tax=Bifidobacterium TaxID=1678 RepID=UPI002352CE35|nr:LacI family DNA-binding transcriptional regulator [Bifidobacterium tibiigranuli]MCH3975751.1 LacI family DNA-binding transcriptional regulator [Bifidobacterium tibiigranuli]MCH4189329.1 LacI family DNA-binding transcriptional regulator [Bifidobacterium tibiigranuli]MCH4203036.1 LacI family DNA-binding transcriptional regulator [Bifidobacterium tibiigranuli]MCH4274815.1 LacI family DNA-binding transcriptional regulator [Bifidobacterium tibiigranuli]MCI1211694.1 LacI family DNA-binding transc
MAKPKLSDVAKRAGVSATTVSRVLNNRGYLSAATKQAVHQAIDELGYRPNEIARSLLGQRTYLIGLIVPTVANPFFGELAAAIEGALATSGYKMLLCNSQGQAEQERAYLDLLQANQVDGIITSAHNDLIDGYAHATLPIVAVDRQMGAHIPNVRSDNAMGGRIATELLINQGCRSIVLVTATDSPQNARAGAYRTALKAAGIVSNVFEYGFDTPRQARQERLFDWLDCQSELDGLFATDDLTALLALEWAKRRSIEVPDALKIVGYDGTPMVTQSVPGLTTVVQPIDRIAERAVSVLLARIGATASVRPPDEIVLPVDMHRGWTA